MCYFAAKFLSSPDVHPHLNLPPSRGKRPEGAFARLSYTLRPLRSFGGVYPEPSRRAQDRPLQLNLFALVAAVTRATRDGAPKPTEPIEYARILKPCGRRGKCLRTRLILASF